jgi:hypothetical protein
MTLNASDILEIDTLLEAADAGSGTLAALRSRFPKLSLTRADPSDIGVEPPFREYKSFDLYLVDGSGHCWSLTNEPRLATGLVLVEKGKP